MARRKKVPLNLWETASNGKTERYIRPGYTLLTNPAYKRLSNLEKHVYLCMDMAAAGKAVFTFPKHVMKRNMDFLKRLYKRR